jgi:membrane protein YdbS with pleckstrin-like domain
MIPLERTAGGDPSASAPTLPGEPHGPPLRRLARHAVTYWRLDTLWRGAVPVVGALAAELTLGTPLPTGTLSGLVAATAVALAVLVPPLRYRAWGFALRDDDLYVEHGVLFRTASIVPHARIQHVDTRHGPLHRWLGLAAVVVFTAGTRGARIEIPALESGEAEGLRDRLAALSGAGDAV